MGTKKIRQTVQYKGAVGSFRKMPRARAVALILARWDDSPVKGDALMDALNMCLKGLTIQEALAERDAVNGVAI